MRKQQKTAIAFESVTAGLLKDAVRVKDMREKENRYSASLIYNTHNAIFGLTEKIETCSTCLLTRSRAIVAFVNEYDEWADKKTREVNARKAQEQADEDARKIEAGEVDIITDPLITAPLQVTLPVTLNPLVVEAMGLDIAPILPPASEGAVRQVESKAKKKKEQDDLTDF